MLLRNAQSFSSACTTAPLVSFTKQSNIARPYPSSPISSSCHQSVRQDMSENHFPSDRCFTSRRFPGDPRFATWIIPTSDDVRSLPRKVFLSTHLLDCILHRVAPPPVPESPNFSHIGSLHTRYFMNNANDLPKTERRKFGRIVRAMSSVFQHNPESVKRLTIPIVEASHFFVLCLKVSIGAPKFIVRARFYDSLQCCTRRLK
jgi:hypothetical protein